MSLDRNTLLQLIRDELARASENEDGVLQVSSAVVHRCQERVHVEPQASLPVPLEVVAAFLDGTLDQQQSIALCARAASDEELMTELVFCVQSGDVEVPPLPLDDDLHGRLLDQVGVARQPVAVEMASPMRSKRIPWWVPVAVAASLLLTFGWFIRGNNGDATKPATIDVVNTPVPGLPVEFEQRKQPESDPPSEAIVVAPMPTIGEDPVKSVATPEKIAVGPVPVSPVLDRRSSAVPIADAKAVPSSLQPDVDSIVSRQWKWTSINGVLVTSNESAIDQSSSQSLQEAGVGEDSVTTMTSPQTFRTLPLSRAEANINSGGTMVLPGDALVRFNDRGSLFVERGAVAMVGVPVERSHTVATKNNERTITAIDQADWLLRRDSGGLWLDVLRGSVRLGGRILSSQTVLVESTGGRRANDAVSQDVERPRWVDKVVDKVTVPRPYLAQLRTSTDTAATLDRQIENLSRSSSVSNRVSQSTLMTLAMWRASLDERRLFELVDSSRAAVRHAALMRIVLLVPTDARHANVWRRPPSGMTPAVTKTLRDRFVSLWRSQFAGQPFTLTQQQANALVGVLQSNSVASRATADYLLRRAFNGGPNFDPVWTGGAQTRGVAGWRTYLQRATNR